MAVRILLMPLTFRALRAQAVQARLAPKLQALRQRYARQPEKLQREMTALYKQEGTSMFAGLVPLLLQWPFLSVMYLLFRSGQVGGKPNALLTHGLLGVPLGAHWLSGSVLGLHGAVFLGLFAVLAVACWLSSRVGKLMAARASAAASAAAATAATASAAAAVSAAAPGGALVRVLPYLTVAIAAFAPLAAGIYLLTSTGWSLAERRLFLWHSGRGPQPGRPVAAGGSGKAGRAVGAGGSGKQSAKQPDRR
jgi:YidC/Oxa1 family membrane protein insertase